MGIKTIFKWYYRYVAIRQPKVNSWVPHDSPQIHQQLIKQLKQADFNLVHFKIKPSDYKRYIDQADYHQFPDYYNNGQAPDFIEKTLEHFLTAKLLQLNKKDIYIDIANAGSPVPEIYHQLYGCKTYRQDLAFPKGIDNNVIGGNAADMPLKNNFADKMALHCSFEHFEGNADINFIKEANRVLKKNGRLCILPLYLFNQYAIQTDPVVLFKNNIAFETDATLYCAKDYHNRHGRFYDIPHLISRIKNNLNQLKLTIYIIQNIKTINSTAHLKFAALLEKS